MSVRLWFDEWGASLMDTVSNNERDARDHWRWPCEQKDRSPVFCPELDEAHRFVQEWRDD